MARILYTDPRDYNEPFLLIKIKKVVRQGMVETQGQGIYYSQLIFASIMQNKDTTIDGEAREYNDVLSIKFRKMNFEININDFIYRAGRVYQISHIDRDLFNLQEQKIIAVFYNELSKMPDLKQYVDNLDTHSGKEVNKEITVPVKDLTTLKEFKDFKEQYEKNYENLNSQTNDTIIKLQKVQDETVNLMDYTPKKIKELGEKIESKFTQLDYKINELNEIITQLKQHPPVINTNTTAHGGETPSSSELETLREELNVYKIKTNGVIQALIKQGGENIEYINDHFVDFEHLNRELTYGNFDGREINNLAYAELLSDWKTLPNYQKEVRMRGVLHKDDEEEFYMWLYHAGPWIYKNKKAIEELNKKIEQLEAKAGK
ncbi:hypothetical protein [Mycoplasma seminis]|uniref:DUF31 domain-containing protein n=1 Tax=Mycoplasma seminis TaxID=512749 RepID=A0ABY9HAD6_9MOLU|nr:hypothetical protein [Mycoplasma seminis]WLP85288.1 hypothetical protein Q8852_03115 [Mycoplasma seminis]